MRIATAASQVRTEVRVPSLAGNFHMRQVQPKKKAIINFDIYFFRTALFFFFFFNPNQRFVAWVYQERILHVYTVHRSNHEVLLSFP